ncbi:TspO protein [Candidatus Kaiserbacteria bacterium CG10_big_fil_rev_8_21_14_0_10_45_20]|uniref:TspO protein n=1 Tax=Candidatus Kaiserbacteria bacterium CG10_big_fil_rev_8_21_14_0_10_45_20 TaxID=1974607 RepID=A0A2H0UF01_9BACT|nr:MAG: TspO protein [Candidatus Kaiserbacteria bacterium CG10_big_fil_rev_8_21_14_0_10_45_20]
MKNILLLALTVIVSHSAGIIGSLFTVSAIPSWYAFLEKPFFAPPNWVFAPAWLLLYTLMGVALFLIIRATDSLVSKRKGIFFFAVQLVLNALWSIAFFGLQSPLYGLIVISVLLLLIGVTTYYFFRVSKVAGWLMVPYIAWVSFATLLNASIFLINS